MARKKDLGNLAALAGMAYILRDKEGKGNMPTGDDQYNPDVKQGSRAEAAPVDLGEIRDEAGTLSTLRRNTETGEMYDPTGSGSSMVTPSRSTAAKAKPVAAKTPSNPNYGNEGRRPIKEPSKLQYQSLQDRARTYEEERAKSGVGMYGSRKAKPREALPTAEDMAYKKGGSVKGWGISRGARKAKIY